MWRITNKIYIDQLIDFLIVFLIKSMAWSLIISSLKCIEIGNSYILVDAIESMGWTFRNIKWDECWNDEKVQSGKA